MDYDMDVHIPNQIEALLQHRAKGDVNGFDYILDVLRTIANDNEILLSALTEDNKKRNKNLEKLFNESKNQVLNAFEGKNTVDGLNTIRTVLTQVEQAFNAIELEYMNDVVTSLVSYEDDGVND